MSGHPKPEQPFRSVDGGQAWRAIAGALRRAVRPPPSAGQGEGGEEERRRDEVLLGAILENAPAVVYQKDVNGRYLFVNKYAERLRGLPREAMIGKTDADLFPDEYAVSQGANDREVLERKAPKEYEATVRFPDGPHTLHVVLFPLCDKGGQAYAVCGIAIDVTGQKRAEAELRTRARQQAAIALLGQRAMAGDLDGLFQEAVELIAQTLGVEYAKVLEVLPGHEEALLRAGVGWREGQVGQARVSLGAGSQAGWTLRSEGPVVMEDLRTETRFDGSPLLHEHGVTSGLSVPIGGRDQPWGVLGAHTSARRGFSEDDATFLQVVANVLAAAIEHRQTLQREQSRRAQLQLLREITAEMVRELDLERLLALVIRRVAAVLNASMGTICFWDSADQVLVPRASHAVGEWLHALRYRLGEGAVGLAAQRREGVIINDYRGSANANPEVLANSDIVAALAEPILFQDRLIGVIALGRNAAEGPFTAQDSELLELIAGQAAIAIENARLHQQTLLAADHQKMQALGQLAGGAAHDLNQFLALIGGYGELAERALAEEQPDLARVREFLATMRQAAHQGSETIRGLLTFARRQPEGRHEELDLGALLGEVARLTAPRWRDAAQAEGRPIQLELAIEPGVVVTGSRTGLQEAFINLVLNAVDALPNGGQVRIAARRTGSDVEVEVSDTGEGMSEAVLARVFEPYFTTKGERGTGLGLSQVYGIVEQHGGRISVSSRPGQGATFRIVLPSGSAPAETPTDAGPAEQPGGRSLRVLAVDDEPTLARMAAMLLEREGHVAVVATSGEEALQRLAEERFDVLITDIGMGEGMNGWELAARARRGWPELRILLATGWGAQIDPDEALARGVDGVIAKPYGSADLRRALGIPS